MKVSSIVVLGAGSAGLIAALTLKRKLPGIAVRVVRSPDIGIIGVGEGTTAVFPRHFFEYLKKGYFEFYQISRAFRAVGVFGLIMLLRLRGSPLRNESVTPNLTDQPSSILI